MKLVIVESPAKCTTIQRYLGEDYVVKASLGHIRDLATKGKGGLGVDVENGFAPTYAINKEKIKVINELKALAKKADEVILATDPDREGEAIAWHLAEVLGLDVNTNKRLEFHEITRDSITHALETPRTIDLNLVSSQETRRILDRIIGFKLSTLLNSRIKSKSAGRVQSATLKLISDHDKEIAKFVSEEYWNILCKVSIFGKEYDLNCSGKKGENIAIRTQNDAEKLKNTIEDCLVVKNVEKTIRTSESKSPFTTSTMQQEAFSKLKFNTKKTQFVAQSLYEGISIDGEHVGLITYMRTDSTRLSPTFVNRATAYIKETYGEEYLGNVKHFQKDGHMQDAHEAIRPTSNHRTPESVRKFLTPDQYNLYKLVYNRTLASLMKPKKEEVLKVDLQGGEVNFELEFSRTIFKGYTVVLLDEGHDYSGNVPTINAGDSFPVVSTDIEQKFTQAPAPYSEAKIVKLMEEVGIGRPSTYASTIETIKQRKYVTDTKGVMTTTEQGFKTIKALEGYFKDIVDTEYTAKMENKLDSVQDGSVSRLKMLNSFYEHFSEEVEYAKENMPFDNYTYTGTYCPKCGSPLIYREGKNGKFIGCSNFPTCRYVEKKVAEVVYTGEKCPKCGKPLVERSDKKGNKYIGCSGFPECNYIVPVQNPNESEEIKICPKCGGRLLKKKGKYGYFYGCENYPSCNYMEKISKKRHK